MKHISNAITNSSALYDLNVNINVSRILLDQLSRYFFLSCLADSNGLWN